MTITDESQLPTSQQHVPGDRRPKPDPLSQPLHRPQNKSDSPQRSTSIAPAPLDSEQDIHTMDHNQPRHERGRPQGQLSQRDSSRVDKAPGGGQKQQQPQYTLHVQHLQPFQYLQQEQPLHHNYYQRKQHQQQVQGRHLYMESMLPSPPSSIESTIARQPFSPTSDRSPTPVRNSNLYSPAMSSIPSPVSSTIPPYALSSTSIFTSSSDIRRKQSDTIETLTFSQTESRGKGKAHNFSTEEETFIATLLSDPNTWTLLDGTLEKNSHYKSKTKVREEIAQKFNTRFSTENPVDAQQIKNKIGNMKDKWKKANALINRPDNGDKQPDSNKLQDGVRNICHFYYILDPVWSKSLALNSAVAMDPTTNTTPHVAHDAGDAGEQESGENSENEDGGTTRWDRLFHAQAQDWSVAPERSKRRRDTTSTGTDMVEPVEGLESAATDEQEIKRRKVGGEDDQKIELERERLAFERKKLELKSKEAELQILLLEMQVKKIQAEIVNERERIQLEHRKLDIEQLKVQADLESNRRNQTLRCRCSS